MDTNDLGFAGKVALVAGASKGIGAATARAFARAGASVVLLPRSQAAVEAWGLWPNSILRAERL